MELQVFGFSVISALSIAMWDRAISTIMSSGGFPTPRVVVSLECRLEQGAGCYSTRWMAKMGESVDLVLATMGVQTSKDYYYVVGRSFPRFRGQVPCYPSIATRSKTMCDMTLCFRCIAIHPK